MELGPFVTNDFGDRFLEAVNRTSFNQLGYEHSFRENFGSQPFQEDRLYVMVGTDSGLLIRFLLRHELPPRTHFLLLEIPEVLDRIKEELALDDLGKKIVVTTEGQLAEQVKKVRFSEYASLDQVVMFKSLGAIDGHLSDYADLHDSVRGKLHSESWLAKVRLNNEWFVGCRFDNLGENQESATCLEWCFQGKTAMVLGGAPSLDDILPWLEKNRQNLVLISVGRISGRLLATGVVPDFIVTADPMPESFDNSRETLSFWKESVLIHTVYASPPLVGQWRGRSFYHGDRFDWATPLNGKATQSFPPTVSNFAVGIGVAMGFRRILLAGVDFCFSKEGVSHAQGSMEHIRGSVVEKNLTVETNMGEFARSIEDFVVARDEMGKLARAAQAVGCEIVNLAPGAAKIGGVAHLLPEQIDFTPSEHNSTAEVVGSLSGGDGASRMAHYQAILAELGRARSNLTKINNLFKITEVWKAKDRLAAVEKALSKEQQEFFQTITKLGGGRFLLAYAAVDLENLTESECDRASKLFFSAFADSSKELLAKVEAAEQRLAIRMQEELECPDFAALAAQWRADNQPGRIVLWEDRFPDRAQQLTGQERELVQALKDEYVDLLAVTTTLGAQLPEKSFDANEMRAIIQNLFKRKDREALDRVGQSLTDYKNIDRENFVTLIQAHVAELIGAEEQALAGYRAVAESGASPVLEDALARIVALALKFSDHATALGALERLSKLSSAYEPRYAEALAAIGNHDRALDVYADYLDKNPSDIAIMLRLGQYYQQLEHFDGARFILTHVLELEPGNRTAEALLARIE